MADSNYMPYGCKAEAEVVGRCLKVSDFLVKEKGVKAIVVACNTATAVSIRLLREKYHLPIIGMEPPIKPAIGISCSGKIGVLATRGTVSSEKFHALKQRFSADVQLLIQPCPGLVESIESGDIDGVRVRSMLSRYLKPLLQKGIDTLVLGCTHYPFLMPLISEITGGTVAVLDAGDAVARELKRHLMSKEMLAETGGPLPPCFYSSGNINSALVSRLWGEGVHVEKLNI